MAVADDEGNFFMGGGDIGMMAAIASTYVLTTNAVPWSDLQDGRGWWFGDDPHSRWVVLWDLMIDPGESPVFNDLSLWEMS